MDNHSLWITSIPEKSGKSLTIEINKTKISYKGGENEK